MQRRCAAPGGEAELERLGDVRARNLLCEPARHVGGQPKREVAVGHGAQRLANAAQGPEQGHPRQGVAGEQAYGVGQQGCADQRGGGTRAEGKAGASRQ